MRKDKPPRAEKKDGGEQPSLVKRSTNGRELVLTSAAQEIFQNKATSNVIGILVIEGGGNKPIYGKYLSPSKIPEVRGEVVMESGDKQEK